MKSTTDKNRQSVQHKLSPKYYGAFKVLKKVGQVEYKLELPSSAQVHSVFHVSQLKKCKAEGIVMGIFPHCQDDGLIAATPVVVLDRRMVKKKNRVAVQLLVQWANCSKDDATWEMYKDIQTRFPEFVINPCGQGCFKWVGIVSCSIQLQRLGTHGSQPRSHSMQV
ncbi:reverse transcriptase [Tanacetum coccineum]